MNLKCNHGKTYEEECLECCILWHELCLTHALEDVQRHKEKLSKLQLQLSARDCK